MAIAADRKAEKGRLFLSQPNRPADECVSKMSGIIEHKRRFRAQGGSPSAWSDEKLLLEYRDHGNRPAFEELVRRYEKELYGYLRHCLGDAQMAEDVFQQTFLQVHLKCGQFECERKLRPWLYAVATNQAIDFQRRSGRHRMVSLDRRIGGPEEEESRTADRLVRQPGPEPGRGKPVVRRGGGRSPRSRGVAGADEASGDVGLLPRIEVPRGSRSVVHSRGDSEESHPRGDREADGIAGIGR